MRTKIATVALCAALTAGVVACKEGPTGPCDHECGPDEECIHGECEPICDPPCPDGWYCYHVTRICFYGSLPDDSSTDSDWEPVPLCPGTDTDGDFILDEHEHLWDPDGDTIMNPEDDDSDNDTILDIHEAGDLDCLTEPWDYDGDTRPDFMDEDSDHDDILDSVEAGDDDPDTRPRDTDGWGHSDFRDTDSDNDGLGDEQEVELGTDPYDTDTDGDGYEDMDEIASLSGDPLSASRTPGDSERIYWLWYRGRSQYETFHLALDYKALDVFMLVDDTHASADAVQATSDAFASIIAPTMEDSIAGLRMGTGVFSGWLMPDVIMDPACSEPFVGLSRLDLDNSGDVAATFASIPHCPEPLLGSSLVDALWQVVDEGSDMLWSESAGECVDGIGGGCFSSNSRHVIMVLLSGGYPSSTPAGWGPHHDLDEVTDAMAQEGVHVVGLVAGETTDPAWPQLTSLAAATATTDLTGRELIYSLGADGELAIESMLAAVSDVTTTLVTDATLEAIDGQDWPDEDGTEEANRMVSIWPVGWSPPPGFSPSQACDEMESDSFLDCVPGTELTYEVYYRNYSIEQRTHGQWFATTLVLSGTDGYIFATIPVRLVVPALDGDSL